MMARCNVHQWKILMLLSRLELIEFDYTQEFDVDGLVIAEIDVHLDIKGKM